MFPAARFSEKLLPLFMIAERNANWILGGRRFSEGTSADREIQRTLMELLNQMDGFDSLGKVKIIMATNRPDTLDPALLRPGRLDRKIEIPLPNEQSRLEVALCLLMFSFLFECRSLLRSIRYPAQISQVAIKSLSAGTEDPREQNNEARRN